MSEPGTRSRSGALRMRPAGPSDLETVVALLTEAARWSRARGLEGLWRDPYPTDWVLPSLQRGEVFVADLGAVTVGTLTFRWEDPATWGRRPPEAGYVHKLAVRRSFKGRGLGARMLDWAGDRAAREGRPWLRLDCLRSHEALRSYYESLGFRRVGEATVEGNAVTLLERPAVRRGHRRRTRRPASRTGNIK